MNCQQVQDHWHDAMDDTTQPPLEVEAHLRDCDDCQRYVDQMSQLVGALDSLHDVTEHIVSRPAPAERDVTHRGPIPIWHRVLHRSMRVAAVLLLVVTAGLYLRHRQAPTSPTSVDTRAPTPVRHASLELRGPSAEAYLAVREESPVTIDEPVDVIWLYRLSPEDPDNETPRSSTEDSRKEKRT